MRERGLREQLVLSERQLVEAGQLNMSVTGENSFSGELAELAAGQVELQQQRQQLEAELGRARAELEEERAGGRREGARAEALARELEEAQCEVVSYSRQVDRGREEVQELEQQLELERQGKVDRDGKGNSLFSEVEDRREKVEVQLRVFEDKYGLLKENYDCKLAQVCTGVSRYIHSCSRPSCRRPRCTTPSCWGSWAAEEGTRATPLGTAAH